MQNLQAHTLTDNPAAEAIKISGQQWDQFGGFLSIYSYLHRVVLQECETPIPTVLTTEKLTVDPSILGTVDESVEVASVYRRSFLVGIAWLADDASHPTLAPK